MFGIYRTLAYVATQHMLVCAYIENQVDYYLHSTWMTDDIIAQFIMESHDCALIMHPKTAIGLTINTHSVPTSLSQ